MIPNPDDMLRMFTAYWDADSDGSNNRDSTREFVNHSYLIGMNSAFRFWSGWSKVFGSYCPEFSRLMSAISSDPNESEQARQTLLNNLNTCFREMSDLSDQELRRLRAEIEESLEKTWPSSTEPDAENYWRRWNVKP